MARGRLSLLERNQRIIGTVALLVIVGGTAFALLLQGGFLTQKYRVTALFTDAAGVREGDNLTVAGLIAGRVEDVRIEGGQVAMDLGVKEDVDLPADSRAEVVVETLLGRKSVALVPGESEDPLEEGDVIPLERTRTPVDIPELNDISVELLEASDAQALEDFLGDVGEITKGKAREVQALIGGLERVTAAVDARRGELEGLIESLRVLSTTLGERDDTIVSLIDNLDVVLGNLAERQGALERLLVSTASASEETADLVRRNRLVLDDTLRFLHRDLEVLDRHQLDIAGAIAYLENGVQGYSSVGYSQCSRPGVGCVRNRWANIFIQSLGPLGVDAIVGSCGLVDQLFDRYFGTDCEESDGRGAGARRGGERTETGGSPPPSSDAPPPPPDEASDLPCTIEDLLDSALASAPVRGGCA